MRTWLGIIFCMAVGITSLPSFASCESIEESASNRRLLALESWNRAVSTGYQPDMTLLDFQVLWELTVRFDVAECKDDKNEIKNITSDLKNYLEQISVAAGWDKADFFDCARFAPTWNQYPGKYFLGSQFNQLLVDLIAPANSKELKKFSPNPMAARILNQQIKSEWGTDPLNNRKRFQNALNYYSKKNSKSSKEDRKDTFAIKLYLCVGESSWFLDN